MSNMKKERQFNLVAGIFTPADAKEILISLIDEKIRFHNLKILSHQERFGVDDRSHVKRFNQLIKTKSQIQKMIATFEKKNKSLVINSKILIDSTD